MDFTENQKAITRLRMEYNGLMHEYSECIKRDDFFEIKRRIVKRMRMIEQELDKIDELQRELNKLSGNHY